jgi:hypothetical protein
MACSRATGRNYSIRLSFTGFRTLTSLTVLFTLPKGYARNPLLGAAKAAGKTEGLRRREEMPWTCREPSQTNQARDRL